MKTNAFQNYFSNPVQSQTVFNLQKILILTRFSNHFSRRKKHRSNGRPDLYLFSKYRVLITDVHLGFDIQSECMCSAWRNVSWHSNYRFCPSLYSFEIKGHSLNFFSHTLDYASWINTSCVCLKLQLHSKYNKFRRIKPLTCFSQEFTSKNLVLLVCARLL